MQTSLRYWSRPTSILQTTRPAPVTHQALCTDPGSLYLSLVGLVLYSGTRIETGDRGKTMSRGARILKVEQLAANAWPAAETVDLDGWRLRYSEGVTRRANSVWPNQTNGSMALPDKLTAVEAFYERRRQEPAYQICDVMQPPDLDGVLAARGYATSANTEVQTAAVEDLLSRLSSSRHVPEAKVTVSETFDPDWFELYRASEDFHDHESTVRRAILQRIQPACGYALLHIGNEPAAVGLGVVERGYVGLFCMATAPRFRRQGAARAILRRAAALGEALHRADSLLAGDEEQPGCQKSLRRRRVYDPLLVSLPHSAFFAVG